mmetsp:Transcript_10466/g.29764  ORF Transcript_10466/g.29764 Transcript_10466/m.29764 type:complete len:270 (-) Transcript_10466:830-1639(-)
MAVVPLERDDVVRRPGGLLGGVCGKTLKPWMLKGLLGRHADGGVLLEQHLDKVLGQWAVGTPLLVNEGDRVSRADILHRLARSNAAGRAPPGVGAHHQPVQHDTGAPVVGFRAVALPVDLRGEVLERACAAGERLAALLLLGAAEVDGLHFAQVLGVPRQHKIRRLDVCEDNLGVVAAGQKLEDVLGDGGHVGLAQLPAVFMYIVLQAAALQVLHHQIGIAIVLVLVQERHHQRGELQLLQEPGLLDEVALHLGGGAFLANLWDALYGH